MSSNVLQIIFRVLHLQIESTVMLNTVGGAGELSDREPEPQRDRCFCRFASCRIAWTGRPGWHRSWHWGRWRSSGWKGPLWPAPWPPWSWSPVHEEVPRHQICLRSCSWVCQWPCWPPHSPAAGIVVPVSRSSPAISSGSWFPCCHRCDDVVHGPDVAARIDPDSLAGWYLDSRNRLLERHGWC